MIIVYGGAFNPVTTAHLELALKVLEEPKVQELVWLPVGNNYQKPNLVDCRHRINMANILTFNYPNIKVSSLECVAESFKGTYNTLKELQQLYNNAPMAFLLGADHLMGLPKWIEAEKLLQEYSIWVMPRPGFIFEDILKVHPLLLNNKERIKFLKDLPLLSISATHIRNELAQNRENILGLSPKVHEYIKRHKLYEEVKE